MIYEEGGQTRGLAIYVFEGKVYIGGWNRARVQLGRGMALRGHQIESMVPISV